MNTSKDYTQVLKARKAELEAKLLQIEGALTEHIETGFSDSAVEHEDDEVLEAQGRSGQEEIIAIDAALNRIDAGTFGICINCENKISEERLDIIPTAIKCKRCMG